MVSWRAKFSWLVLTAGLVVAAGGRLAVSSQQAKGAGKEEAKHEQFPHVRAAVRELREAKKELERAAHDFGGHRAAAVKASDHAIEQLEKALRFERRQ